MTIPDLSWERQRTYFYDGKSVGCDLKTLPFVYRFELTASFDEKIKYQIKLYFPLSTEHYQVSDRIEKLSIVIDQKDGLTLELYELVPSGGLCDINCSDTVLCNQLFDVTGIIVLTVRNEKDFTQIVL